MKIFSQVLEIAACTIPLQSHSFRARINMAFAACCSLVASIHWSLGVGMGRGGLGGAVLKFLPVFES